MFQQNIGVLISDQEALTAIVDFCKEAGVVPTILPWTGNTDEDVKAINQSKCDLLVMEYNYDRYELTGILHDEAIDVLKIEVTRGSTRIKGTDYCLCCTKDAFNRKVASFVTSPSKYLVEVPQKAQAAHKESLRELRQAHLLTSKVLARHGIPKDNSDRVLKELQKNPG